MILGAVAKGLTADAGRTNAAVAAGAVVADAGAVSSGIEAF
jgi:hypothetical protein